MCQTEFHTPFDIKSGHNVSDETDHDDVGLNVFRCWADTLGTRNRKRPAGSLDKLTINTPVNSAYSLLPCYYKHNKVSGVSWQRAKKVLRHLAHLRSVNKVISHYIIQHRLKPFQGWSLLFGELGITKFPFPQINCV